jgi:hypothetical protein
MTSRMQIANAWRINYAEQRFVCLLIRCADRKNVFQKKNNAYNSISMCLFLREMSAAVEHRKALVDFHLTIVYDSLGIQ